VRQVDRPVTEGETLVLLDCESVCAVQREFHDPVLTSEMEKDARSCRNWGVQRSKRNNLALSS
jgi:hypothetical protein